MKYSKLPRIYVSSLLEAHKSIQLDNDNLNYLKNVMRLKEGFSFRVFNEACGEFLASFSLSGKVQIQEILRKPHEHKSSITLFASIIKQDKFELMCDMAVQLGVSDIVPIITDRVQKRELNIERLKKIMLEASRQCERLDIASISEPIDIKDIKYKDFERIYFANENEDNTASFENKGKVGVIVGAEGGFTDEEVLSLSKIPNVISVSLGENVLRAETATVAMLARLI